MDTQDLLKALETYHKNESIFRDSEDEYSTVYSESRKVIMELIDENRRLSNMNRIMSNITNELPVDSKRSSRPLRDPVRFDETTQQLKKLLHI